MKILVCISQVPDTTSKINFTNGNTELDTNGLQYIINPYDEFGLTKAILLKEQHGGSVTVVHVGPATTEPTIRKALAIGADDAVRIDAIPVDGFQVAKELASYISANAFDLIICGQESIDYNGAQVPGMLSALLNLPYVSPCVGLDIQGSEAVMTREIDGGKEVSKSGLPVILAGKKGLVEEKDLRIPNMRGIMTARTKPLQVVASSSPETKTKTATFTKPAPKASVKMIDKDNVAELVTLLHNEAKVI